MDIRSMDIRDQTPRARRDGFVVEEVDGETLAYHLETHEAYCLNPAAALVWHRSDGRTTVRDMARHLGEVGLPLDESLVWMALSRLEAAKLVEPLTLPEAKAAFSRKQVLRVLGAAAAMTLLLPAVDSVVAPLAAQAASCVDNNVCVKEKQDKKTGLCSGLPICGKPGQFCLPSGKKNCSAT